jgi:hypothetical protein
MEYFRAICYNLWPFGIVFCSFGILSQFGVFGPRKIWQPCWLHPCDVFFRSQPMAEISPRLITAQPLETASGSVSSLKKYY